MTFAILLKIITKKQTISVGFESNFTCILYFESITIERKSFSIQIVLLLSSTAIQYK